MSRSPYSLDDGDLRRQVLSFREFSNYDDEQLRDKIANLSPEKLRVLSIVHILGRARSKEVAEKAHINRASVINYLKKLAKDDKLLVYSQESSKNSGIKPTYIFFIANDRIKQILGRAIEAINSGEPKNQESNINQTKEIDQSISEIDNDVQKYQNTAKLPPTGQKIFQLLGTVGQTVKQIADQIGCDITTASKYLKSFYDKGLVQREVTSLYGSGRNEYLYFLLPLSSTTQPSINQTETRENNHFTEQTSVFSPSTVNMNQSQSEVAMSPEVLQSQSSEQCNSSTNTDPSDKFQQAWDKLDELIAVLDQAKKLEEELRILMGTKAEKLIAKIKSSN